VPILRHRARVSILTRPEGRVQHGMAGGHPEADDVSILTRPEGRVQLTAAWADLPGSAGFNPHPSRRTGATSGLSSTPYPSTVSILTRPEGRVQLYVHDRMGHTFIVSILTRPEGRVQPMHFTLKHFGK